MNSEELGDAIKQIANLENGGQLKNDQKLTGFIQKFKSKEQKMTDKKKGIMARAAEKFEEKQKEAESKEIEDILSNPISAMYN